MKFFTTCLFSLLWSLSLPAQSISLIPSVCDEDTALVSVSVGPFSQRVTYSATLNGEPLSLYSFIYGDSTFLRTISVSGIDTVTITHYPADSTDFDSYFLNLQMTDGMNWWVSQPIPMSGSLYPVIPDCEVVFPPLAESVSETADDFVSVWPNPFTENLNIVGKNNFAYDIITLDGKLVTSGTAIGGRGSIDGSMLTKGMYVLVVTDQNGQKTTTRIVRE